MTPAVDHAMDEERPAKGVIRELWCQLVQDHADSHDVTGSPLYVTLCGAEGRDIQLLIDRGLVRRTEVGSIAPEHSARVVAIESRMQAIAHLKEKFPGLRVIAQPIENLLSGMDLTNWPGPDHERVCRGLIMNLDLNTSLRADRHQGHVIFPIVRWVEKIALLHAQEPQADWWLCLTLNATIDWAQEIVTGVQAFLAENFVSSPEFAAAAQGHLGGDLYDNLAQNEQAALPVLPAGDRQRVLMTLVPKRLSASVNGQGWRLETTKNIRYGGEDGAAPMVSWIFRFCWDARAFTTPQQVYRESLSGIHAEVRAIAPDGTVS